MISIKNNEQNHLIHNSHVFANHNHSAYELADNKAGLIEEEIMSIYSSIMLYKDAEKYPGSLDYLQIPFERLDDLIALTIDNKYLDVILNNPKLIIPFNEITRLRARYTIMIETEQAHSILDAPDPWNVLKNVPYFSNYLQLALSEYEGSRLNPGDRVVFLGSGPLPLTLIVLCYQYGLQGIGIEQDHGRVSLSRKVLLKLGLSDQIKIVEGNHLSLPLKEKSDLIMVAAQAEPKNIIFNHLVDVLPSGTVISYRIYEKGLRRLLDTFSHYIVPEVFEEYLRIPPIPPVNNTVVFLIKK